MMHPCRKCDKAAAGSCVIDVQTRSTCEKKVEYSMSIIFIYIYGSTDLASAPPLVFQRVGD